MAKRFRAGVFLRLAERFHSGPLYRLDCWLGLPWRCRLIGHQPAYRAAYIEGFYLDQEWYECDRCEHWLGHG